MPLRLQGCGRAGAQGEALKAFDVRDGHGLKLLQAAGIDVAILTARRSEIVALRMKELGIARVLQGAADTVVPPHHSTAIVAAMKERGLDVEYHEYEGEGHGFRGAAAITPNL